MHPNCNNNNNNLFCNLIDYFLGFFYFYIGLYVQFVLLYSLKFHTAIKLSVIYTCIPRCCADICMWFVCGNVRT